MKGMSAPLVKKQLQACHLRPLPPVLSRVVLSRVDAGVLDEQIQVPTTFFAKLLAISHSFALRFNDLGFAILTHFSLALAEAA